MPRTGVTVYDLLLSCPGDVLDLKPTIEECVKSFNSSIGEINNIRIELKHWSTDSFPQSGDKPQNILNKQFVNDCDLCVALLGIRFGTPTDNYDSGTEEEIENMLAQGKQVFLYFVERNVDPSKIDLEQYSKVKRFKEKYTDKGVYWSVKTAEDLRKEFQNALTLYFIKLVAPTTVESQPAFAPNLIISTLGVSEDAITLEHTDFQNVQLVEKKEKKILDIIETISNIEIEISSVEQEDTAVSKFSDSEVEEMSVGDATKALKEKEITLAQYFSALGRTAPSIEKAEINIEDKELILKFCERREISLSNEFWMLGNLQKEISTPMLSLYGDKTITYKGSESEKKKYELFQDLISKIEEFNDVIDYFAKIDNLYKVSFIVSNIGTTFDEDIDIRIYIDRGHIIKPKNIPQPGLLFLDEVVDNEAPKLLFAGYHDADIDDYSNYPKWFSDALDAMSLPFSSAHEEIGKKRRKYTNLVENIFCYDIHESEGEDILCFNIPYLKQNTKMFFPSFLFFSTIPEYVRYEIRSKHSPNVYTNKFKVVTK